MIVIIGIEEGVGGAGVYHATTMAAWVAHSSRVAVRHRDE